MTEAVDAKGKTDFEWGRAGQLASVGGKHRVDHEQAQKPYRKDSRKRTGGAKFLFIHFLLSLSVAVIGFC